MVPDHCQLPVRSGTLSLQNAQSQSGYLCSGLKRALNAAVPRTGVLSQARVSNVPDLAATGKLQSLLMTATYCSGLNFNRSRRERKRKNNRPNQWQAGAPEQPIMHSAHSTKTADDWLLT